MTTVGVSIVVAVESTVESRVESTVESMVTASVVPTLVESTAAVPPGAGVAELKDSPFTGLGVTAEVTPGSVAV